MSASGVTKAKEILKFVFFLFKFFSKIIFFIPQPTLGPSASILHNQTKLYVLYFQSKLYIFYYFIFRH